ncbi:MAG: DedA family protein [Zoogloeaceae bacterium]|jgi:membrane-associated protein|nr:DedA family protein [Zoogloeaceae bacterium]
MEFLTFVLDLVLHLDVHLQNLIAQYGGWVYVILFFIIFAETGFVVFPFLPGDSLLFVAGTLAALGSAGGLEIWPLVGLLSAAAFLGNLVNYQIGRYLGPRVFQWRQSRIFNRTALLKTHAFYERHGGKTIVLSRFLPLIRTFAPFVAGIGAMTYGRFLFFNLIGGLSWVFSLTFLGYWFGNRPWIQKNLSFMILGIVVFSLLPALIGYLRTRKASCADA